VGVCPGQAPFWQRPITAIAIAELSRRGELATANPTLRCHTGRYDSAMPKKGPFGTEMQLVSLATHDRVRTLERLRDRLAEQIDTIESSRDLAVLASRLQAVMAELDDLPQSQPLSKADEIAERRRQRRAQPS
jgi:hypothetical protein